MSIQTTELFSTYFKIPTIKPTVRLLKNIIEAFQYIPYENLSKILTRGKHFRMPAEIIEDYIESGLGGTCFSLTWCLKSSLNDYGFDSELLLADRTYGKNTHSCIRVNLENRKYLADIGYLIFKPVCLPDAGEKNLFSYRNNVFKAITSLCGQYTDISNVFPNGTEKFRYRIKTKNVSISEYFDAWKESFGFEMMNYAVINMITSEGRIYIKNKNISIDSGSRSCTSKEDLMQFIEKLGIKRNKIVQAFSELNI